MVRVLLLAGLLFVPLASAQDSGREQTAASLAAAYEDLATTITSVRAAEDALVEAILRTYADMAGEALAHAAARPEPERRAMLEKAAGAIGWIANEGDARVQAVRQRLLQAGHHHHAGGESAEDYMFVDSKEKKALLDLAARVARHPTGDADGIRTLAKELADTFAKTVKAE